MAAAVLFTVITNIIAMPKEHQAGVVFLPDEKFLPSIVRDIGEAESEITCSLYMFKTDGNSSDSTGLILDGMLNALNRGVKVSLLFDEGKDDDITTEFNTYTGKVLEKAGALVVFDDPERRLHTKMCVIDSDISYIGSHNYTFSAFRRNAETTVRIKSAEIAREARQYIMETGLQQ